VGFFGTVVVLATSLLFSVGLSDKMGLDAAIWRAYTMFIDPGTQTGLEVGVDAMDDIFLSVFTSLLGYAFMVMVIGLVADFFRVSMANMRKKYGKIDLSDHIVILGWSSKTLFLVHELAEVFSREVRRTDIVIMAERERHEMELDIAYNFPDREDLEGARVQCWCGDPIDETDLLKVSVLKSRAVICLSGHGNKVDADQKVVRTVMCLAGVDYHTSVVSVVAEVGLRQNISVIRRIASEMVSPILGRELVDHLIVELTMRPMVGQVLESFLGFFGMTINVVSLPHCVNRTIGTISALHAFQHFLVVGVKPKSQHVELRPPPSRVILEGDLLVVIGDPVDIRHVNKMTEEALFDEAEQRHFEKHGWSPAARSQSARTGSESGDGAAGGGAIHRRLTRTLRRRSNRVFARRADILPAALPSGRSLGETISFGNEKDPQRYEAMSPASERISENSFVDNLAIIGWNEDVPSILELLDSDPDNAGLCVHIINLVSRKRRMQNFGGGTQLRLKRLTIIHYIGSPLLRQTYIRMPLERIDSAMVLSNNSISAIDADSRNITSLLLMSDVLNDQRMKERRKHLQAATKEAKKIKKVRASAAAVERPRALFVSGHPSAARRALSPFARGHFPPLARMAQRSLPPSQRLPVTPPAPSSNALALPRRALPSCPRLSLLILGPPMLRPPPPLCPRTRCSRRTCTSSIKNVLESTATRLVRTTPPPTSPTSCAMRRRSLWATSTRSFRPRRTPPRNWRAKCAQSLQRQPRAVPSTRRPRKGTARTSTAGPAREQSCPRTACIPAPPYRGCAAS
jgi:Trk K+ transport system NAD-binding subunit